jgi:hypothetical protein
MMKKLLAVSTAVAAGVLTAPAAAYADTGEAMVCRASFNGHPESGAGWAVDTFTRTTTIRAAGKGWKVHIVDNGTFTTVPGKPSDGDNAVPIENEVTGSLHGRGDYTVTGTRHPALPGHRRLHRRQRAEHGRVAAALLGGRHGADARDQPVPLAVQHFVRTHDRGQPLLKGRRQYRREALPLEADTDTDHPHAVPNGQHAPG